MLPARYDVLEAPVVMFDRSSPPVVPHLPNAPYPEFAIEIGILVANQACLHSSKNPIRMLCFNMLSRNHWNNPDFEQVVRMAADFVLLLQRKNTNPWSVSLSQLSQSAVEQFMGMYSSSLVFEYKELQAVISPQLFEASSQNAGLLHNVRKEITSMHHLGSYPPPAYPQHMQHQPMQQHPMYPPVALHAQMPQPLPPPLVFDPNLNAYVPAPGYGHPSPQMPPQQTTHYWGQGPQMSRPDFAPRPDPTLTRSYDLRASDFTPAQQQVPKGQSENFVSQARYFDRTPSPGYEPEVTLYTDPVGTRSPPLSEHGESTVNRQAHEIARPATVLSLSEQQEIKRMEEPDFELETSKTLSADVSIGVLVEQFRLKKLKDGKAARIYALAPDVVVSDEGLQDRLHADFSRLTVSEYAGYLQTQIQQHVSDESDNLQLASLRELGYRLTNKVNRFLQHELGSIFPHPSSGIESFMDDYPSLTRFVMKKLGSDGVARLQAFENNLRSGLIASSVREVWKELDILTPPPGMALAFIPNFFSVTYLPFDRAQLGFPCTRSRFDLNPEKDKVILRMVKDLIQHAKGNPISDDMEAETHLLILRDGTQFRIGYSLDRTRGFCLHPC